MVVLERGTSKTEAWDRERAGDASRDGEDVLQQDALVAWVLGRSGMLAFCCNSHESS